MGVLWTYRLYALIHIVYAWYCLRSECFSRYSVVMSVFFDVESDTWDLPRSLSQSVNCDFTSVCWTKKKIHRNLPLQADGNQCQYRAECSDSMSVVHGLTNKLSHQPDVRKQSGQLRGKQAVNYTVYTHQL